MKANEIMVGDYLCVNRDGICTLKGTIVRVSEIDSENTFREKRLKGSVRCETMDGTWLSGGVWCDYLDPISLTPKILEKNGFEKQGFDGWLLVKPMGNDLAWQILWRTDFSSPYLTIYSYSSQTGNFSSVVSYVHQLQHALRLCQIDKEIMI